LTQQELAARLRTSQSLIARWERGVVEPSFAAVVAAVEAAGLDLLLELAERDPHTEATVERWLRMTPLERLQRNQEALELERLARAARTVGPIE
jgi:transcriptional regulator with XRE-family HTH domain